MAKDAANSLPRCYKCDKEFEKLLACGRCKAAFYCSRDCQNKAWKVHKNFCEEPDADEKEAEQKKVLAEKEEQRKKVEAERAAKEPAERAAREAAAEAAESAAKFRNQLLQEAQVANAKMLQATQECNGDPSKFLPQVIELKDEYERRLEDILKTRNRELRAAKLNDTPADTEENTREAAVHYGKEMMKEVIMAILKRGLGRSAAVDQLDIANNLFNAGILWPRPPADFALEDGDLDGFEAAVLKVKEKGFVCVDGLLDDDIATTIHNECTEKYWDSRANGSMHKAAGAVVDGYECWLPYPARKGTSPELEHALRVLFGLPHELQRNGYPVQLRVPTMAHLGCFTPKYGREKLHLDHGGGADASGGRELTMVLFCSPDWKDDDGGSLRAYLQDNDCPGPRPDGDVAPTAETGGYASAEDDVKDRKQFKDFSPDTGRCLIFQSRRLWHEMLAANKLQFALTLFVQCAD